MKSINTWFLFAGILVVAGIIAIFAIKPKDGEHSGGSHGEDHSAETASTDEPNDEPSESDDESMEGVTELKIVDTVTGEGEEATNDKSVSVHYTGKLMDGTKFDSSHDRGTPFKFVLGSGQVIKGWEQGILGMKVGGKRTLTIPPHLAYGEKGAGGVIPPNATLVFDVELIGVE